MEEKNIAKLVEMSKLETRLCVPCLVCGESVAVETTGMHVKICEKCRKAILKTRKEVE